MPAQPVCREAGSSTRSEIAGEAEQVRQAGGLFIIGTERHESRRIDNQLRGRAGRQGDPGETRFYISLEDDLMRLFGGERIKSMMETLEPRRGHPHREQDAHPVPSRTPRPRWSPGTSSPVSPCWSTTT